MVPFLRWLELNLEKPAETTESDFLLAMSAIVPDIKEHFQISTWYFQWTKKPYQKTLQFTFKTKQREIRRLKKHLNAKLEKNPGKFAINEYAKALPSTPELNPKTIRNFCKLLQITSQIAIELTQSNSTTNTKKVRQDPLIFAQKFVNLLLNQLQPLLLQTNETTATDFYLQQAIAKHTTMLLRNANPNLPKQSIQDAVGQIQEETVRETKNNIQQRLTALIKNCL